MKFSIITLGCKVNAYESQYYAGQLEKLGYEQVSPDEACDICIIVDPVTPLVKRLYLSCKLWISHKKI